MLDKKAAEICLDKLTSRDDFCIPGNRNNSLVDFIIFQYVLNDGFDDKTTPQITAIIMAELKALDADGYEEEEHVNRILLYADDWYSEPDHGESKLIGYYN